MTAQDVTRFRRPQEPKKEAIRIQFARPDSVSETDVQAKVRRFRLLKAEIKNRQFIASARSKFSDPKVKSIIEQFGVRLAPELSEKSIRDLQLEIYELESEFEVLALNYGPEDIKDIYSEPPEDPAVVGSFVEDEKVLDVAQSVVAIVKRTAMNKIGDEWHLDVVPFNTILGGYGEFCSFEQSYDAPTSRLAGTGFLVQPDIIATAAHVIERLAANSPAALDSVYFVFGFVLEPDGEARTVFSEDDVYEGSEVIEKRRENMTDWALVKLTRPVVGREELAYRKTGKIEDESSVYMIGHPHAMTAKYSGPATVTENTPCVYFLADLDTGPYNSGSPVFNAATNVVEGILVRDVGDYEEICDCFMEAVFSPRMGIPGVDVIRTTEFAGYLAEPDSFMIRTNFEPESNLTALIVDYPDDSTWLEVGEYKRFAFDDAGVELVLSTDCRMLYYPKRGSVWDVTSVPGADLLKMEEACYP
jgi:V8-like Glu-specific endopeptidase